MTTDKTILDQAISLIDQERLYLREERCAYEAFRNHVRLATVDTTDVSSPSESSEMLLLAYRNEVVDALDQETVCGNTLAESLKEALSPSSARVLVSKEPLTQRRKRNLLVETAAKIERREEFRTELDDERAALDTFADELSDINEVLKKLPACSVREQPFERLLVVWEAYETLLDRCEQILKRRQRQVREAEQSVRISGKKHARNEFLYSELDTQYPVLSEIAVTCERIHSKRNSEQSSQTTRISTSSLN